MTDHILATVRCKPLNLAVDMELPATMELGQLMPMLQKHLQSMATVNWATDQRPFAPYCEGVALQPTETLASSCVLDGAVLDMV